MEVVFLLGFTIALPIVYLLALSEQIVAGKALNVLLSLLVAGAVAVTAVWAINHSRSDWASMGYFLVPGEAALAGWLVLSFSRWRDAPNPNRRLLRWLALPVPALLVAYNVAEGIRNISENRAEDEYDEVHFGPTNRNEKFITAGLQQNAVRREEWLDSTIRARLQDSVFLSVALRYDFISPGLLDTLASSPVQDVALRAIINQGVRAETLVKSYRAHSGSDFFVHPVAHNPRTPPDILREIYRRPHNTSGIEISLAANPSTPRDVLHGLAESARYPETIQALLTNGSLDCGLFTEVASYLAGSGKALALDYNPARLNEARPRVCAGDTGK